MLRPFTTSQTDPFFSAVFYADVLATISGVSPSCMRRVRALSLGDLVVSGPWLGQVSNVPVDVDVSFDDGAVCTVTDANTSRKMVFGKARKKH